MHKPEVLRRVLYPETQTQSRKRYAQRTSRGRSSKLSEAQRMYCTSQNILLLSARILRFRHSRDRIAQANPDDVTLVLAVRIPFRSSPPLTPD